MKKRTKQHATVLVLFCGYNLNLSTADCKDEMSLDAVADYIATLRLVY